MRIVMFYHSLISDWNHGNAHFLRGIAGELLSCGHDVRIYEDQDSWSVRNLIGMHGTAAIDGFHSAYPRLKSIRYRPESLDLDDALEDAALVLVHEWNPPELVARIGKYRARRGDFLLLFHDTHHRAVTAPHEIFKFDLSAYDGVLAFGEAISSMYRARLGRKDIWTWHEAADTRVFRPYATRTNSSPIYEGDLVWIGNWGDGERTAELREFLLEPVKQLGLKARIYGVRYPQHAMDELAAANIEYGGWLPNYEVPRVFSRYRVTVHVPRRPYVKALPGIPTIRVFEALACGIPLVSALWHDAENLFTPGRDYLLARDGQEMVRHLAALMEKPELRSDLSDHARRTILVRHTCAHRVDELLRICGQIAKARQTKPPASTSADLAAGAEHLQSSSRGAAA
ncbi:MAG TPA: glycosyltransferase [Candidatus Acidoferrales bacterium]|nr:glycosyltransferase [Candidatus Acidoferrales bacterium]